MCKNSDFVHLHNHTDTSVQDALPKPKALALKAREMGFPAVAITDHGRMGGVVEFVDGCRSPHKDFNPIKPILGCEIYTVADCLIKENVIRADGRKGRPKHNHLTLLAQNHIGYRNLLNISSIGAEKGYYYDPRVDWGIIAPRNEGIIALSGCLGSEVNQALLRGDEEDAEKIMRRFKDVFGDRYYCELQYHGIPEQKEILPKLALLAKKLDIVCIASNDVHYLEPKDWRVHDILIQMRNLSEDRKNGKVNGKKEAYGTHQFYLKSAEEMNSIFKFKPEVITNTLELSERIEDFMKLDVPHLLPHVDIPITNSSFDLFWKSNLPYNTGNEAYLAYLAMGGLEKLGLADKPEYRARLKYELSVIWYMGVVDYFLIEAEMVDFMMSNDILYGIRGSGVGSLVAYAIGINRAVDPIRFNLQFERFLNPGRGTQYKINYYCYPSKKWITDNGKLDQTNAISHLRNVVMENTQDLAEYMPRIEKELWVLENQGLATYIVDLAEKGYTSKENTSQLWTAYFLGITAERPEGDMIVSKVATLPDVDTDIDDRRRGEVIEWARRRFGGDHVSMISTRGTYQAKAAVLGSLKVSDRFSEQWGDRTHEMAQCVTKTIPVRQQPPMTIESALDKSDPQYYSAEFERWSEQYPEEIEIAKQLVGVISHMGVHAGGVIVSSEPISDHAPIENSKGVLASAYDMSSVERVGLVKYDYLGLATYQMISLALGHIKKRHGIDIDLTKIDLDDKNVLDLYTRGKTSTVFQFASTGMQKTLKDVKADHINDLIAVNALFRPGPMAFIDEYAKGKRYPNKVTYAHPLIKKYLEVTYGVGVYQEQIMFLTREMAGLDWLEMESLRKGISKKKGDIFQAACNLFKDRALARGVETKAVDEVLRLMAKFGGYAFCKAHATAYSVLSFWTAHLRTYYPAEWIAACFHVDRDDENKVAIYQKECRDERIIVEQPNVNESSFETTVSKDGRILLPLTLIKGVGSLATSIVDNQPFEDLKDLAYRAKPNIGMLKALCEGGALHCFKEVRGCQSEDIMTLYNSLVDERTKEEKAAAKLAKRKFIVESPMKYENDDISEFHTMRPVIQKPKRAGRINNPLNAKIFADDFLN